MAAKRSAEGAEAVSRREFMRDTAASAATLVASTQVAHAATKTQEPKPPEKVLIFGHVLQRYLKQWQITSDFDVVARKLGVRLEVVGRQKLTGRLNALSDAERAEAAALAKRLIGDAKQHKRPRPTDAEVERPPGSTWPCAP